MSLISKPAKPAYDFDFITRALGLIKVGDAAINRDAIIEIEPTEGGALLVMNEGLEIELTHDQLAEMEKEARSQLAKLQALQNAAQMPQQQTSSNIVIPTLQRKH